MVRQFVDGVTTFADLFAELEKAVTAGPQGAFYVTGYSLHHDAKLGPRVSPGTPRSVVDVATAMAQAGGDPRFLALQILQLDPAWVHDVESAVAIIGAILSISGGVAAMFQDEQSSEQLSFFVHSQALAYALIVGSASLDSIIEGLELNRGAIEALDALPGIEAKLDPVDADIADNPHATTSAEFVSLALNAQRNFNVFHQKIQIVRNADGIHAYCGGIDLNANRTQDGDHASRGPFHDVHARVNGPAAGELVKTFSERWERAAGTPLALDAVTLPTPDTLGSDVVQVARTYYGPVPGSGRGFVDFAPNGERTIIDTLLLAISRARRYIFIEDQYLTPPAEFATALARAASTVAGPLLVVIPGTPDQPFGFARRQAFLQQMRMAWGDRFKVGLLRKRFSRTPTSFKAAQGRLWLAADLGDSAADNVVELGPPRRLPDPPFWLVVDGEAMRAHHKVPGFVSPTSARFDVNRAGATNLFRVDSGTRRSSHKAGAAVVTGVFPDIYVHSKIVLIDDAFASIGSANCNRRGLLLRRRVQHHGHAGDGRRRRRQLDPRPAHRAVVGAPGGDRGLRQGGARGPRRVPAAVRPQVHHGQPVHAVRGPALHGGPRARDRVRRYDERPGRSRDDRQAGRGHGGRHGRHPDGRDLRHVGRPRQPGGVTCG